MTPAESALAFIERFCAGDVDGLEPLLTEDLHFSGPLFTFTSRASYLDSLRADSLDPTPYTILEVLTGTNSVAVFYILDKPTGDLTLAQLFRFEQDRIAAILLVFDARLTQSF
ncbi:MAG: nuclear transport factor 2 family protein [Rhodothermaceae bacterium]|nr:nuclear transport factor 2 family protein [Rhodothermaceae bacterium]